MKKPDSTSSALAQLPRAMLAVAWSFIGLRKNTEWEKDANAIHPFVWILVGLLSGVAFVAGLYLLVRWVVTIPVQL